MNFFEHQDRAQRLSKRLVLVFIVAVLAIVLLVTSLVALVIGIGGKYDPLDFSQFGKTYAIVAASTAGLIFLASLLKTLSLSHLGGVAVALEAGGRPIDPKTTKPQERQLLNIVEEMSIASGVPMPEVFVLPESGINAFAAGFTQRDAAIGVTEGCLKALNRDELQGVIAHEFSHIFHGDMRLNMKITGVIFGILALSFLGRLLLRGSFLGSGRSRRGDIGWIAFVGFALFAVGSFGVFFGRIIQAAVSRQREFLADASAVQYTRNPAGIAGALQKIGSWMSSSWVRNAHAEELSHFFIASPFSSSLFRGSWLSTHPPLADRIRAIDPSWDGEFEKKSLSPPSTRAQTASSAPPQASRFSAERLNEKIGEITTESLAGASLLRSQIPAFVLHQAQDLFSVRAVVYSLFFSEDTRIQEKQLQILRGAGQSDLEAIVKRCHKELRLLGKRVRLPLIDTSLPLLKRMSKDQKNDFLKVIRDLVLADNGVELFEYALSLILTNQLLEQKLLKKEKVNKSQVQTALSVLLSGIARAGHKHEEVAQRAFQSAIKKTKLKDLPFFTLENCGPANFTSSLSQLAACSLKVRELAIRSMLYCAAYDRQIQAEELELLRAVGECLEVPIPLVA